MGPGQALDQSMQAQAAQLVAHAPWGDVLGPPSEQDGERLAQVLVGESARDEDEHEYRVEQRLSVGVSETQRGDTLSVDLTRTLQALEGVVAQRAVVADLVDLLHPLRLCGERGGLPAPAT